MTYHKMLYISWFFLNSFAAVWIGSRVICMSLPLNAGDKGGSRTENRDKTSLMEKTRNLVLPKLVECCVSVSKGETLKQLKCWGRFFLFIIYIVPFIIIDLFIDMKDEATFILLQIQRWQELWYFFLSLTKALDKIKAMKCPRHTTNWYFGDKDMLRQQDVIFSLERSHQFLA